MGPAGGMGLPGQSGGQGPVGPAGEKGSPVSACLLQSSSILRTQHPPHPRTFTSALAPDHPLFHSPIRANVAPLAPPAKMGSQGPWGFLDRRELLGLLARMGTR